MTLRDSEGVEGGMRMITDRLIHYDSSHQEFEKVNPLSFPSPFPPTSFAIARNTNEIMK